MSASQSFTNAQGETVPADDPRITYVYVASAWWRDCDPFATIVADTRSTAQRLISESMLEEAERAWNDSEPEDSRSKADYLDEIAWSGVFAEPIDSLNLTADELAELKENGYVWQE